MIKNRLTIILYFFLFLVIFICIRIIHLSLQNLGDFNTLINKPKKEKRGDIVDCNGVLLATNDIFYSVYAYPLEVENKLDVAEKLSKILNLEKNEIINKLNNNKKFVWIKRHTKLEGNSIKIKGIYVIPEYKRVYPNNELASNIIGFCNLDNVGIEGLEKTMDSYQIKTKDNTDMTTDLSNKNFKLTIDSYLQSVSQYVLKESIIKENASVGTFTLINGKTGKILAMASFPDYDPNEYSKYNQENFRNNPIFYQFEPGSVFKVFSLAACLDIGVINFQTKLLCTGSYTDFNHTVKCNNIHGEVNFHDIMKYSCNVGTLKAVNKINSKQLYSYIKKFGFGEYVNINLTGEQPGILRDVNRWSKLSMLAIPIGQEISVTNLQIVQASTAFVNDGIMIKPYLIDKIYDDYSVYFQNNRVEIRRVLKEGLSKKILNEMDGATEPRGTAQRLKVEGIKFASKSGTAQIFDSILGKYSNSDVNSSLLLFFPYEDPEYILYTSIHNPTGNVRWGGVICAELVNNFFKYTTGYFNFKNKTIKKDLKIENKKYEKIEKIPFYMLDFSGLSAGDAIYILSKFNLNIKFFGEGRIFKQIPDEGEIVNQNSEIVFYLK